MIPITAITVCINHCPVGKAIFEVIAERGVAANWNIRDIGSVAWAGRLRFPHGPTRAADVEVLNRAEDLNQHIAQVARLPNAFLHLEQLIARQIHSHQIVALTELVEGIEACRIKGNGSDGMVKLFAFVQVSESNDGALGAVAAVQQHSDGDIGLHVLVDARPAEV